MRALIGLLVLGCLFIMAASWQNRTTAELQSRRALRYAAPADAADTDTAGWSRLIFGRPSGSEPLPIPERALPIGSASGSTWPETGPVNGTGYGGDSASPGQGSSPEGSAAPGRLQAVGLESTVAPRYARDFEYVVRDNDSLSVICQKHYEWRPLPKLVEAVSLYNNLKSPDSIRAGNTILLPDAAVLFPE